MRTFFYICFVVLTLSSCHQKIKVDFILKDATIYTLNNYNDIVQCMAVANNSIVAIGNNEEVLSHYFSDSIISLKGKFVYPAFIDAHAHFFGLADFLGECNLYGTKSIQEIIRKLKTFRKNNPDKKWLIGRGWDQNLFDNKQFPTKEALDSVFADIPVCLKRVDGHAVWTNSKAIEIAGITTNTKVKGGTILLNEHHQPTGIFIDNAMTLIEKHIPKKSKKEIIQLLKKAEAVCFHHNVHTIHDAGLELWQIQLLDSLIETGFLKIRIYAMALLNEGNLNYFIQHACIDKKNFKVKGFKIYADGALGSRGALLKQTYNDWKDKTYRGLSLISYDSLKKVLKILYDKGFQACTHAIGDSANKLVLQAYSEILPAQNNRRWRIEHAQIVDSQDIRYFQEYHILPSVQPTHAVSDKNWAIERIGNKRVHFAYCYQTLWQQNKILPLGTDFPVEDVSPLKTFFAAVFRKDYDLKDTTTFQAQEKLNRLQTLKGMTLDAAYAGFMENEIGSLEVGKTADFIILDFDLMNISEKELSEMITKQHNEKH